LASHELGGLLFAAIAILHLLVNWSWIVGTLRRLRDLPSWRDAINLLLNFGLFVAGVLAIFSGLMISEVLLPLVGVTRSTVAAWSSLHRLFSMTALVLVGLHIALNWDWIVSVSQRLFTRRARSVATDQIQKRPRLDLGWSRTVLHSSAVLVVASVICAVCSGLVRLSTADRHHDAAAVQLGELAPTGGWIAYNGFTVQSDASAERREAAAILVRELATALMTIGVAAIAGRTVLRLRLRSRPIQ
jgi:hypothetical protein